MNWGDSASNPYFAGQDQTPFEKFHAGEHPVGVVEKCTFCESRVAEGKEPACVQTCITKCRTFGDLDDPDCKLNQEIRKLGAHALMAEYGTNPSIYYAGLE